MTKISFSFFCVAVLFTAFTSCTNIYYVAETVEPLKVYSTSDTTSFVTYTIPTGGKVLTKKHRKFFYVIYQSYKGYAYSPFYTNYHKYNSSIDGDLYGYSSIKSKSKSKSSSSGGPVHVKGYYRKNGTYVKPYTRKAPSKRY